MNTTLRISRLSCVTCHVPKYIHPDSFLRHPKNQSDMQLSSPGNSSLRFSPSAQPYMQLSSPDNSSLWFSPSAQPYMQLSSPDNSSLWFSPSAQHAHFSSQVITYPLRTTRLAFHSFNIHVIVSDDPGSLFVALAPSHVKFLEKPSLHPFIAILFKLVIGIDMPNVVRSLAYILSFSQSLSFTYCNSSGVQQLSDITHTEHCVTRHFWCIHQYPWSWPEFSNSFNTKSATSTMSV